MCPSYSPVVVEKVVAPDLNLEQELADLGEDANLEYNFVRLKVISASDIPNVDGILDKSDPYCVVTIGESTKRTPHVENDLNPVWNEKMLFLSHTKPEKMEISVYDNNNIMNDVFIGQTTFTFGELFDNNGDFDGELPLFGKDKGIGKGSIHISLRCRSLKPIENEIKLKHREIQLNSSEEEKAAINKALDQSEKLRGETFDELTSKEKKVTEFEKVVEGKSKEIEDISLALKEVETKHKDVETVLTEKESEMKRKDGEYEKKLKELTDALSAKEKDIAAANEQLKAKADALSANEKELAAANEQLKAKADALSANEKELTAANEQLKAKADELLGKEKELTAANEQLKAKGEELLAAKPKSLPNHNDQELNEKDKIITEQKAKIKELEANVAKTQKALDIVQNELSQRKSRSCIFF